jgi:hypothetical protein
MEPNQINSAVGPKKYSSIIKWSLVIGIVIVINLFFNYTLSLIYKAPKYDKFCKAEQVVEAINTKDICLEKGGQWNENYYGKPSMVGETIPAGYCDLQFTCNTKYQDAYEVYERNVFVTLVILGIILVAGSFALSFNWILSVASSMGGILSIVISSMRYWSVADNWLRVGILFLALIALIYFSVRKFKD